MSEPLQLTRDASATMGFVVACLFSEAIDKRELQAWADHVIGSTDSYPLYILDLSTFDRELCHLYEVIGFVPHCDLSDSEDAALVGIAYARGRTPFEPQPTREQALATLGRHTQVLERFRATFPFLEFPPDFAA
jgi:hypothetical protein